MRSRLGQHFLINHSALKKIAAALSIAAGDTIVEIGPGHGELTSELLTFVDSHTFADSHRHGKIIAIEKDGRLASELKTKFAKTSIIEIIEGDALRLLPSIVNGQLSSVASYKLVGNIPYYITGHLLRVISEMEHKPKTAVFTIQEEVAERICAEPPRMNRLAASTQHWATPSILFRLPKEDFSPPPEVNSAVIKLKTHITYHVSRIKNEGAKQSQEAKKHRKGKGKTASVAFVDSHTFLPAQAGADSHRYYDEAYYRAVRILFQQPRKTILNNLEAGLKNEELGIMGGESIEKRAKIGEALKTIGANPTLRPQDLSIKDIECIAELINN
ncbi:MAG: rRNA adenine dimethyltransferase family protein [bacterium]|nr:rRNA adenine dimethyltransferase family protein [bacterium]